MTEIQDAQKSQQEVGFVAYDDKLRKKFDEATRHLLDKLQERFHRVEIDSSGDAWCIRVYAQHETGPALPLAAIGNSAKKAAERLWRIGTFFTG